MSKQTLLYQPDKGYCYNSDTIFLYDFLLKCNISKNSNVLEVGSGCGILGILLSRDLDICLTQIEIQEEFFNLSKINTRINKIQSKIIHCDFLHFDKSQKFDYIISNPPFYDSGVLKSDSEHLNICKINSALPIEAFFKKVSSCLSPKGEFIFCYNSSLLQEVSHYLYIANLRIEKMKFIYPKKDKLSTLVLLYCKKSSKSALKTEPSLTVFDGDDFSDNVKEIYKNANTYTIKCKIL